MLFYLLWIPALIVAGLCLFVWHIGWWTIPALLGAYVVFNLLYLLYVWILCQTVTTEKEYDDISPFYYRQMMLFIDWALAFLGVDSAVKGKEKLPEGEFLLVCNHRSLVDPLMTELALKDRSMAFISKPENINKLFLGRVAHRCGFLPIDRENARNALVTINKAADNMKKHLCSYGIYPEGTRTKTGDLQEFHAGSFKAAQKARVPVVVSAITGSEQVLHGHFPFRRTKVELTILDVLDAETVKASKTKELAEISRNMILEKIGH